MQRDKGYIRELSDEEKDQIHNEGYAERWKRIVPVSQEALDKISNPLQFKKENRR
jgi:hypothetical protein